MHEPTGDDVETGLDWAPVVAGFWKLEAILYENNCCVAAAVLLTMS